MSLYTDFKSILADAKALHDSLTEGPLRAQLSELRERVFAVQEKALDAEHTHRESVATHKEELFQLKAAHREEMAKLQAENAELKRQLEALANQPETGPAGPVYGGDRRLDF